MPTALANSIHIHYDIHGAGEPVVLIGGLGSDAYLWVRQIPALAQGFQVIAFDNRGAGASDKPDEPYTIPMFAADTAGLLDALGIEKAHIVGASMGGFIAQEFALTYPQRVNRLVLACTHFGGPNAVPIPQATLAGMLNRTGDPETDIRASFKLYTPPGWPEAHPDLVEQYVRWRVAHPQPVFAFQRQAMAGATFDAESRLGQLTMPVLITHGEEDQVVPVENARLFFQRIPHARLRLFPNAGHLFIYEQADEFNQVVIDFLKGV